MDNSSKELLLDSEILLDTERCTVLKRTFDKNIDPVGVELWLSLIIDYKDMEKLEIRKEITTGPLHLYVYTSRDKA